MTTEFSNTPISIHDIAYFLKNTGAMVDSSKRLNILFELYIVRHVDVSTFTIDKQLVNEFNTLLGKLGTACSTRFLMRLSYENAEDIDLNWLIRSAVLLFDHLHYEGCNRFINMIRINLYRNVNGISDQTMIDVIVLYENNKSTVDHILKNHNLVTILKLHDNYDRMRAKAILLNKIF